MRRKCVRCEVIKDIKYLRYSRVYKKFVCVNRVECNNVLYRSEK